jgi:hypothetical protein
VLLIHKDDCKIASHAGLKPRRRRVRTS